MSHSERKHAKLSPSSMARILKCPGSVVMCEGIEQAPSAYAEEGTLAHEIAEAHASMHLRGIAKLQTALKNRDDKYDEDMHHYGKEYAKFLRLIVEKFKPTIRVDPVYFEFKTHYSEDIWGTVDFFCSRRLEDNCYDLLMVDYKYGKGVDVSPEDNAQLLTYATCLDNEIYGTLRKAYAYIYQPRTPGKEYSRAVYTAEDIKHWSKKLDNIEKVVKLAEKNGPEKYLNAEGLDHCKFCAAKSKCPAFLKESKEILLAKIDAEDPVIPAIKDLTMQQKVNILKAKKSIETYLADIEHDLLMGAMAGEDIPEYKVVSGRSQRKWISDEKAVVKTLKELGCDPYKKSLIGIGDAERSIKGSKKVVGELIADITEKPPGKLQLAPIDDKRQAIIFHSKDKLIDAMDVE